MVVRLSTKGQLIIPKSLRDRHGWSAGTKLEVLDHDDGLFLRPVNPVAFPATTFDDLFGCADYSGPRRTLEEMEEGIARGAREQR